MNKKSNTKVVFRKVRDGWDVQTYSVCHHLMSFPATITPITTATKCRGKDDCE